jgi:formylmethanofuran dehydrogenase subunit E
MTERPECDYCGRMIRQKRWYEINGDVICVKCLNDNFRVGADDEDDDDE